MLGQRLKQTRKEKGYSARKMAALLGIGIRHYLKYESGDSKPALNGLIILADTLDVSTDYLLCRDEFLLTHGRQNELMNSNSAVPDSGEG